MTLGTEVIKFKHLKKRREIKTSEYKFLQSGIILGIFLPYLHVMIFSLVAQISKQSRQKYGLMRVITLPSLLV